MSYDNNGNGFCGFGGGWEVIILLLFFAMAGGGWGNNGWGNNGNTASETAALVQQNALRDLASNTNATVNWTQQLMGGAVQALERIGDKVDRNLSNTQQQFGRLDTELCQVTNNLTQQINATNTNVNEKFCQLNQHVDRAKDDVIGVMVQNEMAKQAQQISDLKAELAVQRANCARENGERTILAAIAAQGRNGCCGAPYGTFGNGCCGGNSDYQNAVIAGLTNIGQGINALQNSQASQTTQLNAILARVNQIPTTTGAA